MKNLNGKEINYFIKEAVKNTSEKSAVKIFNDCVYKRGLNDIKNYEILIKMITLYQKNEKFGGFITKETKT